MLIGDKLGWGDMRYMSARAMGVKQCISPIGRCIAKKGEMKGVRKSI